MTLKNLFFCTLLGSLIFAIATEGPGLAQDAPKKEKKVDKEKKEKKKRAKPRGRLPNFYRNVFSTDQEEKIYAIQGKYADRKKDLDSQIKELNEKIKELRNKAKELQDQMSKEIEAVLTPEQLAKVKKLQDEADAKRKAKAEQKKKDAEKKKAESKAKAEQKKKDAQ